MCIAVCPMCWMRVTSPTIRKRILKQHGCREERFWHGVTSPTIRKRILKHQAWLAATAQAVGYIAYDPQEDTET